MRSDDRNVIASSRTQSRPSASQSPRSSGMYAHISSSLQWLCSAGDHHDASSDYIDYIYQVYTDSFDWSLVTSLSPLRKLECSECV
jgi:hypothetical protein